MPGVRYFAYGSNLDLDDLQRWCRARGEAAGGIRPLHTAWLPDHAPVFHYHSEARGGGALSVRRSVGSATPGALFEVDEAGWRALDRKEGAPVRYRRVEVQVLDPRGVIETAVTYVVTDEHRREDHVAPTPEYVEAVKKGLARFELPARSHLAAAQRLEVPAHPSAVFVYGTLRRGEVRAARIDRHGPTAIERASVAGRLVDLGDYPGLVRMGEPGRVVGELVRVREPAPLLEELDEVEGFLGYGEAGSLYHRVLAWVSNDSGSRELAWTYRYRGRAAGRRIESGDWRDR